MNKINYCFIMDMYSDYYVMEEIYLSNDVISLSNGKTVDINIYTKPSKQIAICRFSHIV